jgi:hypothetical protein
MKKSFSVGFVPYEIGDKVKVEGSELVYTILDIKFVQFVSSRPNFFSLQLAYFSNVDFWIEPEKISEIIKEIKN